MNEVLDTYSTDNDDGESTVADLLANVLSKELGTDDEGKGLHILTDDVTVSYYEHVEGNRIEYASYDQSKQIKSLMWNIPFGQTYTIELPDLDFELGNDALPIQLKISAEPPIMNVTWKFSLSFGYDEEDGFFLYTFPDEGSEFEITADLKMEDINVNATLLYFLNMELTNAEIEFGVGIYVDIDKERATRQPDDATAPTPNPTAVSFCCQLVTLSCRMTNFKVCLFH